MKVSRYVMAVTASLLHVCNASAQSEIAEARQDFLDLCADCHNADAQGNGPLAKNLTKAPPDLTRIKQRANGIFDERAVYDHIIGLNMADAHGSREMPIWGDWLMDDEALEGDTSVDAVEREIERRIMGIVDYLKSLQVDE